MFAGTPSVNAADLIVQVNASTQVTGTVTSKYTNGTSVVSSPIWTGSLPTSIQPVYDRYQTCQTLKYTVQASLPYETMKSDVTLKLEIWTTAGEKIASDLVWNTDWNPLNGPTVNSWMECGDWLTVGTHNLIVTTEQTLSTNGLLSRYVEGVQTFPFTIAAAVAPTTVPVTVATVPPTIATVPPTIATVPMTVAPLVQNTVAKKPVVKKITCVKGKTRITTTKKTCPKGYKKK